MKYALLSLVSLALGAAVITHDLATSVLAVCVLVLGVRVCVLEGRVR